MEQVVLNNADKSVAEIKQLLKEESVEIQDEDIRVCKAIGEYGLTLVKPGDGILTHCNAGNLQQANTAQQRLRFIWDRSAVTISVSLQMRPDHCFREHV